MRIFASQLLRLNTDLAPYVYDEYFAKGNPPSACHLKSMLNDLLSNFQNVRLLLDGLDEMDVGEHRRILNEIMLLGLRGNDAQTCKLLVLSQDLPSISSILSKKSTMSLNDANGAIDDAIRAFVRGRFEGIKERYAGAIPESTIDAGAEKILAKANGKASDWVTEPLIYLLKLLGMFLWVRLVLATLEDSYSIQEFQEKIDSLPKDLTEVCVVL